MRAIDGLEHKLRKPATHIVVDVTCPACGWIRSVSGDEVKRSGAGICPRCHPTRGYRVPQYPAATENEQE